MIYLNRVKSSIFLDFKQRGLAHRANISFTAWRKPKKAHIRAEFQGHVSHYLQQKILKNKWHAGKWVDYGKQVLKCARKENAGWPPLQSNCICVSPSSAQIVNRSFGKSDSAVFL